jgi:hypothetical protein
MARTPGEPPMTPDAEAAFIALWQQGLEIVTIGKAKKDDNAYQR